MFQFHILSHVIDSELAKTNEQVRPGGSRLRLEPPSTLQMLVIAVLDVNRQLLADAIDGF